MLKTLIFCFVTIACAYSFNLIDVFPDKQILKLALNRYKRSADEEPVCCGGPFTKKINLPTECSSMPMTNIDRDTFKNGIKDHICLADCLAKNTGVYDESGNIMKQKYLEVAKEFDNDEYRLKQEEAYYEKCLEEGKKIQEKIGNKVECDSTLFALTFCQMRELYNNCPKDKENMKNKDKCEVMKKVFNVPLDEIISDD